VSVNWHDRYPSMAEDREERGYRRHSLGELRCAVDVLVLGKAKDRNLPTGLIFSVYLHMQIVDKMDGVRVNHLHLMKL